MDFKLERDTDTGIVDIVIEKGDYVLVDKKEEIIQRAKINLWVFRGEAIGDLEAGTDYHNNIFPYSHDDITPQNEIKSQIAGTRGMLSIKDITFGMVDETMGVKSDVETEEGEAKLTVEL